MNIGLTGGIATGKSTVSAMFVRYGAHLVDADQIAREVVEPGSPVLAQVAQHFGQAILREDGSLDRKRLGEIIFKDPKERKVLEGILHPPIRRTMRERMERYEALDPDKLVVVDVPLLFESGLEAMFDEVVVVYVSPERQLQRLMERDGLTSEQAEQRLKAQLPIDEKKRRADIVIDNDGTLQETERQVMEFCRKKGIS